MIEISRETIGKILGILLLLFFILVVPYLGVAFVQWTTNPGLWSFEARATMAVISGLLALAYYVSVKISIESLPDVKE